VHVGAVPAWASGGGGRRAGGGFRRHGNKWRQLTPEERAQEQEKLRLEEQAQTEAAHAAVGLLPTFSFFRSFVCFFLFLFLLPFGLTDGNLNVSVLTVVVLHTVHDHLLHHTDGCSVRVPVLEALLFKSAAAAHITELTGSVGFGSCNTATVSGILQGRDDALSLPLEMLPRGAHHPENTSSAVVLPSTWLHLLGCMWQKREGGTHGSNGPMGPSQVAARALKLEPA
jgi:hypothetical protein